VGGSGGGGKVYKVHPFHDLPFFNWSSDHQDPPSASCFISNIGILLSHPHHDWVDILCVELNEREKERAPPGAFLGRATSVGNTALGESSPLKPWKRDAVKANINVRLDHLLSPCIRHNQSQRVFLPESQPFLFAKTHCYRESVKSYLKNVAPSSCLEQDTEDLEVLWVYAPFLETVREALMRRHACSRSVPSSNNALHQSKYLLHATYTWQRRRQSPFGPPLPRFPFYHAFQFIIPVLSVDPVSSYS